jgi:hypothetical protein
MTQYLPVAPGIDMREALGSKRLTKKWLRDYLRKNPQKDFRNLNGGGTYVNGEECIKHDLTLEVRSLKPGSNELVALVDFQPTDANEWGYQAVVR